MKRGLLVAALLAAVAARVESQEEEPTSPTGVRRSGSVAAAEYRRLSVRGFDVRIAPGLTEDGPEAALGATALDALGRDLAGALDRAPLGAHEFLRSVPIFVGLSDPVAACACYHPSASWLERNGFDPAKAGAVEIANARTYLEWRRGQPFMVLHELAHAYLDLAVPEARPRLERALAAARASGRLDRVLRGSGGVDRHYALTNVHEYFAETTEAAFGVNDFFPFVRAELLAVDPDGAALVAELWRDTKPQEPPMDVVEAATREVVELHEFFHDWFRGRLENSDAALGRFADSMAKSFVRVGPDGRTHTRDEAIAAVRAGHAKRPDGSVRARVIEARSIDPLHVLVRYDESIEAGDGSIVVLTSSALLRRDDSAPSGVVWVHLHESRQADDGR